jgi:hypothetical protein
MNAAPLAPHHAGHYRSQADTFRQMAEIEPLAEVRELLLNIAEQYDKLADHLSRTRWQRLAGSGETSWTSRREG